MLAWNVGGLRSFLSQRVGDLQEAVRLSSPQVLGIMEHKLTAVRRDMSNSHHIRYIYNYMY